MQKQCQKYNANVKNASAKNANVKQKNKKKAMQQLSIINES